MRKQDERDRRQQAERLVARKQADQEGRDRHGGDRDGEGGAASVAVADMADERAADRPHQIAERKHAEGGEQLGDGVLAREEVAADRGGEIAVDRKIVPLEHVADHARRDHLACRRGIHLVFPDPHAGPCAVRAYRIRLDAPM